jgi:hypothetical protein
MAAQACTTLIICSSVVPTGRAAHIRAVHEDSAFSLACAIDRDSLLAALTLATGAFTGGASLTVTVTVAGGACFYH